MVVLRRILGLWLALLGSFQISFAGLVLNEVVSSNRGGLLDENGDTPDWIEIANTGSEVESLRGYGLSDDPGRPFKWVFEQGELAPGGLLVVFASGKDRQAAAPSPVDPGSVSGLQVWLRADRIGAGSAALRTVNGISYVQRWADDSGRGRDAVQGTTARQPRLVPSVAGLNGRPAVQFDGGDDLLTLPASVAADSFCILLVARASAGHETDSEGNTGVAGVSGQRYLLGAQHGGDANAGAGLSVGMNGVAVYEHGSGYMPALAVAAGPWLSGFGIVALNYEAKRPGLFLRGGLVRTGVTSRRSRVTAPVEIGAGAYGSFQGELAEMLVFNRALAPEERNGIEAYLGRKYGLALASAFHTGFAVSAAGETIVLTRPDGATAGRVRVPALPEGMAYGRGVDGEWFIHPEPTPGRANETPGYRELLEPPVFSMPGGFHTAPFDLELQGRTAGESVRYTLDGSEPTEMSPVYAGRIPVTTRAGAPNVLSVIPTAGGWMPPSGVVQKATVVRARSYKAGALPSAVMTRTYWVTARGRDRYTLPVVSLATHRNNFFDARAGIYVAGEAPGGNFSQRGPEWDRPVHVEFYETDGTLAFAQEAGARIHGNTSQGFPIKGLTVDADAGRGRGSFRHRIFPGLDREEFEEFMLRPSGHDYNLTFFRDALMQGLMAETGAETQAYRPAILFLNGEYWGIHNLRELQDGDYIRHRSGVSAGGFDSLEGYAVAREGDTAGYDSLVEYLNGHDLTSDEDCAPALAFIDEQNYIDYKASEIYCYRWDIGNHRLWRPRAPGGRWRWLQYDNDVGWGGFWAVQPAWEFDMLAAVLTPDGSLHGHNTAGSTLVLRKLFENRSVRRRFVNRFADLLNTVYEPGHVLSRIDGMARVLEPEMAEHTARWRAPSSVAAWRGNVQYLRDYATRRPVFMRRHLASRFGLRGTAAITLAVSPAGAGTVHANTVPVTAGPASPWRGVYFLDHPLPLRAEAAPGYRFAGWDGLPGVMTNAVTVVPTTDFQMTARFEPEPVRLRVVAGSAAGTFRVQLSGPARTSLVVERSADLTSWTSWLQVTTDAGGAAEWDEPMSSPSRFHRARIP